jgi:hypothetical protein
MSHWLIEICRMRNINPPRRLSQDRIFWSADGNRHPKFIENTKDIGFRPSPADSPE